MCICSRTRGKILRTHISKDVTDWDVMIASNEEEQLERVSEFFVNFDLLVFFVCLFLSFLR